MSTSHMIAKQRKENRMTQEQLAEKINISRQTLATWEIGRQLPSDNVAILAARSLGISEEKMLAQLSHDRLHQQVDKLQQRYNTTITIEPQKGNLTMESLPNKMTQTVEGVTLTITRIYKSIYWNNADRIAFKIFDQDHQLDGFRHTGERLFLHIQLENPNEQLDLLGAKYYIEDTAGNRSQNHCSTGSGSSRDGVFEKYGIICCDYSPHATSFLFHYDFITYGSRI